MQIKTFIQLLKKLIPFQNEKTEKIFEEDIKSNQKNDSNYKDKVEDYSQTQQNVSDSNVNMNEVKYQVPDNEIQRVKSLLSYHVLDTEKEQVYDDLTGFIAEVLECPIAYIGLIDSERQWFRATVGLPTDFCEAPRDYAFCTRAKTICQSGIVEIPDCTLYDDLKEHELVVNEPYFKYYCGIPLINSQGYVLGTLCVIDTKVKRLNLEQLDILKKMAFQVVSLLELHKCSYTTEKFKDEHYQSISKSKEVLTNIVPNALVDELDMTGTVETKYHNNTTTLFADIVNFTQFTRENEPAILINDLNTCFSYFDESALKLDVEKIKTIGDAYQCICGLPNSQKSHAIRVALLALEMLYFFREENIKRLASNKKSWHLRIGIDSGPVMASLMGQRKISYDIWGDSIHRSETLQSYAEVDSIFLSEDSMNLIKDYFECSYIREDISLGNIYSLIKLKDEYAKDTNGNFPNVSFVNHVLLM